MLEAGIASSFELLLAPTPPASAEAVPEADQASVLSEFSFSTDPAFDRGSEPAPLANATDDQPLEPDEQDVGPVRSEENRDDDESYPAPAGGVAAPNSSGLSLMPLDLGAG